MNRLFFTTLVVIGTVLFGGWLVLSIYAKLRYDRIRKQEFRPAYYVVPMERADEAFLSEIQSNWLLKAEFTNGAEADMIKLAGKTPSISNLIEVSNYKMPPYNWHSPTQNRNSAALGLVRMLFPPNTVDNKWHVSEDFHLAMLYGTNRVYLYRDDLTGLRETLYLRKPK